MKQKLISLLLSSALLTSACGLFSGCDKINLGKKKHGIGDHDWVAQEVVKEKTCTQNGVISYSCSCGETKTKIQQSEGHQCDDWTIRTEATCKLGGLRQGVCKVCEEEISEDIPVSDHVYVNGVCKWCKAKENENTLPNTDTTQSNNSANSTLNDGKTATDGLYFISNGDGTCYLSGVAEFYYNAVVIRSTANGETVTGIGAKAFSGVNDVEFISIPATVTDIPNGSFSECPDLLSFKVDSQNPAFCAVNGILYNKAMTTILCYPSGIPNAGFVLPQSVTTIAEGAFCYNIDLIRICIHSNLNTIGPDAFKNTFRLNEIYYEGSASQWQSVIIGSGNNGINLSEVYYNINSDSFYDISIA